MPGWRDGVLAQAQREGRLPSMVGAVVDRSGSPTWLGAAGEWALADGGAVVDWADLQLRIGSITKTMTAVLVLQAREAGLLRLDDALTVHLPEASALRFGDRTLRGLLSHTAGLPKEPVGPWWERHDGGDLESLLAAQAAVAPMAEEGVEFRYSNLGFGLLGAVVERVLGGPWWELVRRRLLAPLAMDRTTYHPVAPHAQGWSVAHLDARLVAEPHTDTGAMAPAGQVWSTPTDLARWAGFLLAGHPEVLALSVLEEAADVVLEGSGYGLGFRVVDSVGGPDDRDGVLVGHTGTMPGFMASCFVDRRSGTAYVGMANGTVGQDSIGLARRMLADDDRALTGPTEPADPSLPPWRPQVVVRDEVTALLGSWFWGERAFEVRWDQGPDGEPQLELVEVRPGMAYEDYRLRDGRWVGTDRTELEVVTDADGAVDHLVTETYVLTRTPGAR